MHEDVDVIKGEAMGKRVSRRERVCSLPTDMHVHIVGNGRNGSGCWLRVAGWHRPLAAFMLRHIGLPADAMSGDLDQLYVDWLSEMVLGSSVGSIVILAHDLVYDERGAVMEGKGSIYVPNDYVLELGRKHWAFLPAVSIHPARRDALEELEKCVAGGAVMMKCLPNCHNIDCSDPRYRRFWERMAELELPLLAHTGGEHTMPVIRAEFGDPRILEGPLKCGVTVIAAHCGTQSGAVDPDYFSVFAEMTLRYPNLYGDCSAFNVPIRGRHVPECLEPPLRDRILHGSDIPVPVYGHWAWAQGFVSWTDFRRCERIGNLLERDYQLKKAMGFGEENFSRVHRILQLGSDLYDVVIEPPEKIKPGSSLRG